MAVRLIGQKAMNHVVSHIDGVVAAVALEATEIHGRAEARMISHRVTGAAKVTLSHGDTDSFVNLDDVAALSIEFGHMVSGKYEGDKPKYVPGLYIISRAAGLV